MKNILEESDLLKDLFEEQKCNIEYFFENIDVEKTKKIVQKILNCKGTIIISGVGKSGIIANKLAMTLLSTGTKALYLPALDALHGDIGVITENDICLFLSKSGQTQELVNLVPFIRKKGAGLISIVSNAQSKLSKISDLYIELFLKKELCPFNLAPTTSTSVQMIFGDVLVVALMRKKKFTLQEYAKNHPAGSIGNRISLTVKDIMLEKNDIPLCRKNDRIIDVLHELSSKRCGAVIIVDEKKTLQGIFTDGDLRRAIELKNENFWQVEIEQFMTAFPKWTMPHTLAFDAMKIMEENPKKLVTVLPVVKDKKSEVVGIIRLHDIIRIGIKDSE